MAETVGLVLEALSQVIQGMETYLQSIRPIKKYWKYADVISSLAKTLATEKMIYQNNCIFLLQNLVQDEELTLLLENPRGFRWREEVLEEKLRKALGECFHMYADTLTSMNEVMQSLKTKIGMEEGKVEWSDRKKFKSKWKTVIVALCLEETSASLAELRMHNIHLVNLWQHAQTGPPRTEEANEYERPEVIKCGDFRSLNITHQGDIKEAGIGLYGTQIFRGTTSIGHTYTEHTYAGHTTYNYSQQSPDDGPSISKWFAIMLNGLRNFIGFLGLARFTPFSGGPRLFSCRLGLWKPFKLILAP